MKSPLTLRNIVWDRFGCLEPFQPSWMAELSHWEDYTAAFLRSNGLDFRPEDSNVLQWLQAEDRAPFVKMAQVLLDRLAGVAVLTDVEFVLLAHWLPDLHMGSSVTNYAMHHLGLRNAFGFAISDRGLSAPMFALDCIDKYLRDDGAKALLMVMDQKHLLYKSELRETLKPDNSACLMLLERRAGPGLQYLGYRRCIQSGSSSLTEDCCVLLDALSLCRETTVILTSDRILWNLGLPNQILAADPHLVCAAPFAALADNTVEGRDYLLLTRDGDCLTGVGFRSVERER